MLAVTADSPLILLSEIFGWVYFISWALSFYPQLWVNYKLKRYILISLLSLNFLNSVEGYHLDYPLLNVSGYLFYSTCYTVCFFFKDDNPYNNYGYGTVWAFSLAMNALILLNRLEYKIWPLPIMVLSLLFSLKFNA